MLRDLAVTRIADGLGFRTDLTDKIILRMQEAQRDLQNGKTLPWFLIEYFYQEDVDAGTATIPLPQSFLRLYEDHSPHYTAAGDTTPTFLRAATSYRDMLAAYESDEEGPQAYIIENSVIRLHPAPSSNIELIYSFYFAPTVLTQNVENEWLEHAPEWLIGEAGIRMAQDLRDKDAVTIFTNMRNAARDAAYRETILREVQTGAGSMGQNL